MARTPDPWQDLVRDRNVLAMKACLVALFLAGCGKSGHTVDPPQGSGMMKTTSKATFEKGPSLVPKDKLIAWMDSQKRGSEARLLRVPLVLPKGQLGYDISQAKIGELSVYANDAALGEGLADRAGTACDATNAPTCAFRVEGYWRGEKNGRFQFDVNKAELLSADDLKTATFAEVEGESGN